MIFKKIIFNNYKTYYGSQEINLYIPRSDSSNNQKNIILIGGLNGAGKTTIIKAIQEVLYGNRNFSEEEYKKQFSNVINNTYFSEGGNNCSVSLVMQMDSGEEWTIVVKWFFNQNMVMTYFERELLIKPAGSSLIKKRKVENQDMYNKLIDLIMPFHASAFFIFDGEEVKDIILRQNSKEMRNSIHKITGMNAYEQLLYDLKEAKRQIENEALKSLQNKNIGHLKESLIEVQENLDLCEGKVSKIRYQTKSINDQIKEIKEERNIVYASNSKSREVIIKKQSKIQSDLDHLGKALENEYENAIIPIILDKQIIKLKEVLLMEKEIRDKKTAKEMSLSPYREFMKVLLQQNINPPLSTEQIQQINKIGENVWLGQTSTKNELHEQELHDLTKIDYNTLMNLKSTSVSSLNQKLKSITGLKLQYESIAVELSEAPDKIDTSDLDEKLINFSKQEGELNLRARSLNKKIRELLDKQANLKNQITRISPELLGDSEALEIEKRNIDSTIYALEIFIEEDTMLKAQIIENEFKTMLSKLFRKQDEFGEITFDVKTYTIKLLNNKKQEVSIKDRSAGEMQMISSALIWALIKVSDLELPVVIDTPLGRLDSYHRKQLIEQYYTELSHQVIILSTDTEITNEYINTMSKYTYRQYMLDYDQEKKYTIIRDGYFDLMGG